MKNTRKIFFSLSLACLIFSPTFAQLNQKEADKIFDDAEYFFSYGEYQEALFLFLKLTRFQPENTNYNFRTGMTYLNLHGQETKAVPYLEKAVLNTSLKYRPKDPNETKAPYHAWFYLGNAYRINNDLDKALESYNHFKSLTDFEKKYNIRIVDDEIKVCERAKIIKDTPLNIKFTNAGAPLNTSNSDYSPVVSPDENTIFYMNSQKFYDAIMYCARVDGVWGNPVNITSQVGSDGDMIPTSVSSDGKELILIKKHKTNSDIYYSKFDGNLWSKAVPVNNNINSRKNETSASLSPDGKSLYFTSDRPGGLGGLDIYVSKKQSVGDWGPAENLGPTVNTDAEEETPYVSGDNKILFFSSKGHFNMGGFDIFYSEIKKNNQYAEAINLGYPINTTNDNIGYFPLKDGKSGYISIFDENSLGKEDIYKVEILPFNTTPVSIPHFEKDFSIILSEPGTNEKIYINYDKDSNALKAVSTDGKEYKLDFESR